MPLRGLALAILLPWALLHAINRFLCTKSTPNVLPLTSRPRRTRRQPFHLGPFWFKYETTAFNERVEELVSAWPKLWVKLANVSYSVGAGVGVWGMTIGFLMLVWSFSGIVLELLRGKAVPQTTGLVKRAPVPVEDLQSPHLHSMIPGITIPLSDLPLILAALFTSQVIHEAGHAITASLEKIPILSIGFAIHLVIPSAFVSLPASLLESRPLSSRLRIATAGAWHNLLTWLFLTSCAAFLSDISFWPMFGWKDVKTGGVVVLSVESDSPLYLHLPVSSLITKLDDLRLLEEPVEKWESYLGSEVERSYDEMGWCVSESWFQAQPSGCCSSEGPTSTMATACFVSHNITDSTTLQRCIDPVPIFTADPNLTKRVPGQSARVEDGEAYAGHGRRCTSFCMQTDDIDTQQVCIHPRTSSIHDPRLLRISIKYPPWYNQPAASTTKLPTPLESSRVVLPVADKVLVWRGPTAEILSHVRVGSMQPRWGWLPSSLPVVIRTLFEYLIKISVSLFFFNLLPVRGLDGGVVLQGVLDWFGGRGRKGRRVVEEEAYDIEALERNEDRHSQTLDGTSWRRYVERVVQGSTIVMGVVVAVDTIWNDVG